MQIQSIPLFIQVAETVKSRIIHHEYAPGESIPSSVELEQQFGVSNITIRRAMELLTQEGYIHSRRGTRARVAHPIEQMVEIEITDDFRTWLHMAVGRKLGVTDKILDRRVIATPQPIRKTLRLDPKDRVERIRRIRILKKNPISYYINYGSSRLLTQLPNKTIEKRTFIEAFQEICQVKLTFMKQKIRAATADLDLANILNVTFGFPLFFVENIYYSQKEVPMAMTHMFYRSDRYVYTIKRDLKQKEKN